MSEPLEPETPRVGDLDVDPALASGAFVTTVTDIVGFFAFLGLAGVILL